MNREIKFRAWDEQNKEMHYPKDATENFGHGSIDSAHILKHYSIVMQYTGIKDKRGTEIYEGDIEHFGYVIGWNIQRACFGLFRNGIVMSYPLLDDDLEIIGNIHETPELLK